MSTLLIDATEPTTVRERVYAPEPSSRIWSQLDAYSDYDFVHELDDLGEGYNVLRMMPVHIRRADDRSFVASFDEGNIAIGGDTIQAAYQNLVAEILDTFDTLEAEPRLSPKAAEQLRTLRSYFVKA